MKTNQNTKSVIVGVFIAVGLIIFTLGLFVMGGVKSIFGKTISVQAQFASVGGLKKGSNVLFNGVKVGMVKRIQLLPGNKVLIEMLLEEGKAVLIPADAEVKVGSDGMIGNKLLEMYGGNLQNGHLKNNMTLRTGASSSMEEMFSTLQINNKNLVEITTDLKQIARKVANGEGSVGRLLSDATLANDLQYVVSQLKISTNNANALTHDLVAYTTQLQNPGTLTNNLLRDTVIFERLRSTTRQLNDMADAAQKIVNKLNNTSTQLSNDLADPAKPAGMILTDKETANDIKDIIRNLQTGTEKLNQTMNAAQNNFLLRGYFKKKAKETQKDSL